MRRTTLCISSLLSTVSLLGCVTTDDGGQGSASIYIKDQATDDFQEVHALITTAMVHRADGDDGTGENETSDDDGADDGMDGNGTDDGTWITIYQNASGLDIDLLAVQGDLAAFVGEADLEAGKYTQIRFTVESAYGIDNDGERVEIEVSSGAVRVVRPFEVDADMESRIVIDIDLDRSLHRMGGTAPIVDEPRYRMTPVLGTTTVEVVEDDESGEEAHEPGEAAEVA